MKPPIPGRPVQPSNGFDAICSRLIEAGIRHVPNPVVRAITEELHEELKGEIAEDLRKHLGPQTRTGDALSKMTRHGGRILNRLRENRQ